MRCPHTNTPGSNGSVSTGSHRAPSACPSDCCSIPAADSPCTGKAVVPCRPCASVSRRARRCLIGNICRWLAWLKVGGQSPSDCLCPLFQVSCYLVHRHSRLTDRLVAMPTTVNHRCHYTCLPLLSWTCFVFFPPRLLHTGG